MKWISSQGGRATGAVNRGLHAERVYHVVCKPLTLLVLVVLMQGCIGAGDGHEEYAVARVQDFEITGDGSDESWDRAEWIELTQRAAPEELLTTKAKMLYSQTGIYVLFHCEDRVLSATMEGDFMDLWEEDVVEVFLWPDESDPVYFEYELSPLNYELAILVSNDDGDLVRWQPFHYEEDRQTRRATAVQGGEKKSGRAVDSWTAEFFIPYKLLRPLENVPPEPGTTWRANLYRVDYDDEKIGWSWQLTESSYHEYEKFGTLSFE